MRCFGLLLLLVFSGCPKAKCSSSTCSTGCCDASGTCQTGDTDSTCGTGGASCNACLGGTCNALKVCATTAMGGGTGGSGGGGAGGGTGGGGGAMASRTVTITRNVSLLDERGAQTVSSQLSDAGLTLFLADGGTLMGTRTGASYVVQNVPAGEYTLRLGTAWYVSREDNFDLGFPNIGRPDLRSIDAGAATLTLGVSGLPAWTDGDSMILYSQGADVYGWDTDALISGPGEGEVPTSFTWDYGALDRTVNAIDASKGDTLWALYLASESLLTSPVTVDDGGVEDVSFYCNVLEATSHLTSLTIEAGANTATASFTTMPTQSIGISYPRTQWAARAGETHAAAGIITEELYVVSTPVAGSASADLVSCFNYPMNGGNPISDVNRSLTVTGTLPSTWRSSSFASATFRVGKQVLDAGFWSATGTVTAEAPLNQPIIPGVHAPTQVRVQSFPADQLITAAAAAPLSVSWQSGVAPAPTQTVISVVELTKEAGQTVRNSVATAYTRGTSFSFPAGTLLIGHMYQLRVIAQLNASPASAPFSSNSSSTATAITNPFLAQ